MVECLGLVVICRYTCYGLFRDNDDERVCQVIDGKESGFVSFRNFNNYSDQSLFKNGFLIIIIF